jgi:hypothetical protein
VATGQQMGVRIFTRDERLYCYPALIRISPNDNTSANYEKLKEG